MLLGIALANVSGFLWSRPVVEGTLHLSGGDLLDRALSAVVIVLVDQRVYPMFAFLFGYGILQFARSRMQCGMAASSVRNMLTRRHLWLIALGGLHALLLFSGDILGTYGLTGIILTAIFWGSSDRAIKITVWIMVGLAVLGALLLAGIGAIVLALFPAAESLAAMSGPTVADLIGGQSNYLIGAIVRLGTWILMTPASMLGLLIPAAVLLGMLAARHRWIEGVTGRMQLGPIAIWGIAVGVIGALPTLLVYLGLLPGLSGAEWAVSGIGQVTGFFGGIGYMALFGLIGARIRDQLPVGVAAAAAVGKRSLSFYLLQSVVFAPLLAAWGLGWGATISEAGAYGMAVGVWLVSLVLATWMDQRDWRGPAEWVLRRLTYGPDPERRQ